MSAPPFQRFLDEQREPVWRLLAGLVGPDAADDCFQETFLAALRAYPPRSSENLRGWALTIAHRKAMDHHRARVRAPRPVEAVPEPEPSGAGEPALPDERLWALVRGLPDRQRSVLALRFAADLSHAQVSAALGCSEEASRQAAREGLRSLRAALGEDGAPVSRTHPTRRNPR
jgi:RNA polymerase sigma factor (sigma-70 family)